MAILEILLNLCVAVHVTEITHVSVLSVLQVFCLFAFLGGLVYRGLKSKRFILGFVPV